MIKSLLSALILVLALKSHAQVKYLAEGQVPGKGSVSELSWIEGSWTGPGMGGVCEEVWMPAIDGHMIGTFRFWQDGKLIFSEFMNILQEEETFSLKLKHFSADLTPWEEKDIWTTFPLVEIGNQTVWFHGLTIQRTGNEMILHLAIDHNGVKSIEEFRYTKR